MLSVVSISSKLYQISVRVVFVGLIVFHHRPLDPFPLHIADMGFTEGAFKNQPKGYGPYSTRNLPKKLATRNADSYTWLALVSPTCRLLPGTFETDAK